MLFFISNIQKKNSDFIIVFENYFLVHYLFGGISQEVIITTVFVQLSYVLVQSVIRVSDMERKKQRF